MEWEKSTFDQDFVMRIVDRMSPHRHLSKRIATIAQPKVEEIPCPLSWLVLGSCNGLGGICLLFDAVAVTTMMFSWRLQIKWDQLAEQGIKPHGLEKADKSLALPDLSKTLGRPMRYLWRVCACACNPFGDVR